MLKHVNSVTQDNNFTWKVIVRWKPYQAQMCICEILYNTNTACPTGVSVILYKDFHLAMIIHALRETQL